MADKKISQMTLLSSTDLVPSTDYLPIVDPSEPAAADQNKRIYVQSIIDNAVNNAQLPSVSGINALAFAVKVATTEATSAATGFQVQDNIQMNFGTGPCSIPFGRNVSTTRPSANVTLYHKHNGTNGIIILLLTTGVIRVTINTTNYDSTVALASATNVAVDGVMTYLPPAVSTAGAVTIYIDGVILGTAVPITAGAPVTTSNTVAAYFNGTSTTREAAVYRWNATYNRTLSASDVLRLYATGVWSADVGGSTVDIISGWDFLSWSSLGTVSSLTSTGFNSDAINSGRRTSFSMVKGASYRLSVAGTATGSSVRFANQSAVGGSAQIYTTIAASTFDTEIEFTRLNLGVDGLSVFLVSAGGTLSITRLQLIRTGITTDHNAQDAQWNTGQMFDASGNKQHAMLPAAGATIIGAPVASSRQVRWTNTWSGTNELQYIGGVNQAILPAAAYIESIVGVVSGATVEDIIVGDGSDTDRYVAITTGLAAGTVTFTLANRTTDGTNLKLTVDPDANATMSIAWTITYRILE